MRKHSISPLHVHTYRSDNADVRLSPLGRSLGLLDDRRWSSFLQKQARIQSELQRLRTTRISETAPLSREAAELSGQNVSSNAPTLEEILRRPHVHYALLEKYNHGAPSFAASPSVFPVSVTLPSPASTRVQSSAAATAVTNTDDDALTAAELVQLNRQGAVKSTHDVELSGELTWLVRRPPSLSLYLGSTSSLEA